MHKLTKEGEKYLREGLPEKRLLKLLEDGPKKFEDLKKIENSGIAINWSKKNNWIKISGGKVSLTETGKASLSIKSGLESGLEEVLKKGNANESIIEILIKRGLIEEKKEMEKISEVGSITPEIILFERWKNIPFKKYDVNAPAPPIYPGKRQPYNIFLRKIREKLMEMGFQEETGPIIETEFYNFDVLFQPQNHPAREWTDTYRLKNPKYGKLPDKKIVERVKAAHENGWKTGSTGWKYKWSENIARRLMPRAHGTAITAREIVRGFKTPAKFFSIVRVYRPDVLDATHLIEFNHLEGLVVDESIKFRHLLGMLKQFAIEIAGAEKVKFIPDYYPFTEPSVQISAKHPELGWVELGGAGVFRPEMCEPLGLTAPALGWSIGIDRLAMYKLGIKDIRYLFSDDLNWLRESKMVI